MKILLILLLCVSNFSFCQSLNFSIRDISDKVKTKDYLSKVKNCDLLNFCDKNVSYFADIHNVQISEVVFQEIEKRTGSGIFLMTNSRHGQKYNVQLRENFVKEQLESLINNNCKD